MLDIKNINIRDKPKVITAEDIVRRYDLDSLNRDRKLIRTLNDGLTKTDTNVENFIINISNHVENQEDGFITTWFSNEMPTLQNFPFKDFKEEEKESRIGDIVYDRETGNVYQLDFDNEEYIWLQLDDEYLKESMAIANSSADTHDNKRNLYFEEPTTPYDAGDMWYDHSFIKRCRCSRSDQGYHATDWCLQKDYKDDSVLLETRAVLNQFKIEVERGYVSTATLETTKDSIVAKVKGVTTEVTKINDEVLGVKETVNTVEGTMTDSLAELKLTQDTFENDLKTANSKLSDFKISLDEIKGVVEATTDTTTTESGIGTVSINGLMTSEIVALRVHPTNTDIKYRGLSNNTFLSDNTILISRSVLFKNVSKNMIFEFELPCDLLFFDKDIYDEFVLDLENNEMYCIQRVGIDSNKNKYALEQEIIKNFTYKPIEIKEGDYKVYLPSFSDAFIKVKGLTVNINNLQFIPRVEAKSMIKQTKDAIEEQVKLKLGSEVFESYRKQTATLIEEKVSNSEYETYKAQTANSFNQTVKKGNVISEINQTEEKVKINATKIDLQGYVTVTNLKTSGATTINGSNITTGILDASKVRVKNLSADSIVSGTLSCNRLSGGTISGQSISGGTITGATITCQNGKIGNWDITSEKITQTHTINGKSYTTTLANYNNSNATSRVFHCAIDGVDTLYIHRNGKLYAKDVDLTGKITATSGSFTGKVVAGSGEIGGFDIGTTSITSTYDNYRVYIGNTSNANKDFLVVRTGTSGNYKYPFIVSGEGKLTSSDAIIKGNITATGGKIGGSYIDQYSLFYNNGNTGWGLHGTTVHNNIVFHAGANNTNIGGAPFRILHDGTVYATKINITGGTIGGFNCSKDKLYYGNTAINKNGNVEFRNDNGYFSIGNNGVFLCGNGMQKKLAISDMLGVDGTGDVNASIGLRAFYGNIKIASNEWLNMSGALGTYLNNQHYAGTSSKNTKENIQELSQNQIQEVYDIFKNLKFYQYDYKESYGGIKNNYGFLIEDIENTILDKVMHIYRNKKDKNYKNYNSEDLTRLLLIVVQELMKKVESVGNYGK